MRIAFITPSVSRSLGGIYEIERRLGQSLMEIPSTEVCVYGMQDAHTAADSQAWGALKLRTFPVVGPAAFGYSPLLQKALATSQADVAHLHALWMFTSVATRNWSRKLERPYIVTPNGMLEPWALRNSAWKKRIAWNLYERSMLTGATCIQANTEKEAADVRALSLKNPIAIIPNGVDLPNLTGQSCALWNSLFSNRKVLLYLGRLHPKKNLEPLLEAWAKVQQDNAVAQEWVLAIAGWDQGGYEARLHRLTGELSINGSVHFLGPLFDEGKSSAYQNANAFVIPSLSEGLPMVVLEAWAHFKPVLMTPQCNLAIGYQRGAAVSIETTSAGITQGLNTLFEMSQTERHAMGQRGRALVEEQFLWPKIAAELRSVYAWMSGMGGKPSCVVEV